MHRDNQCDEILTKLLLTWYDKHARRLPWRVPPQMQNEKPQAYRVWLSEVMLQQTTVEAVKPYFAKFITKWPNLAALSAAPLEEIMKAWAGLGYYSRARNLKNCADKLMQDYGGEFPHKAAELQKLPGIGAYTAGAIAAIAFNEPCAVIDTNNERVIARLFCIETPLPAARTTINTLCRQLMPHKEKERSGDFAQALMDLGATICTVKKPNCLICPVSGQCLARAKGKEKTLPHKAAKPKREERCGAAFIALSATGCIYLQKRAAKGLLGGMSEIPNHFTKVAAEKQKNAAESRKNTDLAQAPFIADWQYQGQITHIFTHFRLTVNIYKAENIAKNTKLRQRIGEENGFWVKTARLQHEALPTLFKKAVALALPDIFKRPAKEKETKNGREIPLPLC